MSLECRLVISWILAEKNNYDQPTLVENEFELSSVEVKHTGGPAQWESEEKWQKSTIHRVSIESHIRKEFWHRTQFTGG